MDSRITGLLLVGLIAVVVGQSYISIPVSSATFNCTGKTQGFQSDTLDANYEKGYFYFCNSGALTAAYMCQQYAVPLSDGTSPLSPAYFDNTAKTCRASLLFCPKAASSGGGPGPVPVCPGPDPMCPKAQ